MGAARIAIAAADQRVASGDHNYPDYTGYQSEMLVPFHSRILRCVLRLVFSGSYSMRKRTSQNAKVIVKKRTCFVE